MGVTKRTHRTKARTYDGLDAVRRTVVTGDILAKAVAAIAELEPSCQPSPGIFATIVVVEFARILKVQFIYQAS